MAIQGLRTSENFVTDERPLNWRSGILIENPNGNVPLTGLTSAMKSEETDDPEFNWWEKSLQTRRFAFDATTGDLTLVNTTLLLTAGSTGLTLKDGDLLLIEQTDEIVQINGDPSSNTSITVTRGVAGSTAATLDPNGAGINPNMFLIGSANEEGSLAPTGVSYDPTKRNNFTQIFRDAVEITRTASNTNLRTGDNIKEAKREQLELHMVGIEKALWFGKKLETTKNGKPLRFTGGLKYFLDTFNPANVVDAAADHAAGVELQHLEEYLLSIFKFGSSEKMAFCGNRSLLTIQQIVRKNSSFNIENGVKEFGMNVTRLTTPYGELVLKNHPLFNQLTGGTTTGTAYHGTESWMFVLDMANIKWRNFKGADTKFQDNIQTPGMDGIVGAWLTEAGLEINHPETHFLIKNLIQAKVDA